MSAKKRKGSFDSAELPGNLNDITAAESHTDIAEKQAVGVWGYLVNLQGAAEGSDR